MAKENSSGLTDHQLGMDRAIPRRDFLNGAAMAVGAALVPKSMQSITATADEQQNHSGYDPPTASGLRGSHPGSFEIAHSLRDGTFWKNAATPVALPREIRSSHCRR